MVLAIPWRLLGLQRPSIEEPSYSLSTPTSSPALFLFFSLLSPPLSFALPALIDWNRPCVPAFCGPGKQLLMWPCWLGRRNVPPCQRPGPLAFISDGRIRCMCPPGPARVLGFQQSPHGGWMDLGWAWVSSVSPLHIQRVTVSEGYRTAWSTRPALGRQGQRGPSFEDRNRISICIEQTGFNYMIYTSSNVLLRLRGQARPVPDVAAADCGPCRGQLHGRSSLILTWSESMEGPAIRWWGSV